MSFGKLFVEESVSLLMCEKKKKNRHRHRVQLTIGRRHVGQLFEDHWVNQVKKNIVTCTYVLSIGVLRPRGRLPRFALHI